MVGDDPNLTYTVSCNQGVALISRSPDVSSHVFHEIYLHLNWHVKLDRPTLTFESEDIVYKLIKERFASIKGAYLHALGGTETHVHLAISIEPHLCASDVVSELKGSSAHEFNEIKRMKLLEWQRGYGVVSFGRKNLPWVMNYIANQKEHHAKGTAVGRLEQVSVDDS
jgi:putative transposase